jgi:hypothetical protein
MLKPKPFDPSIYSGQTPSETSGEAMPEEEDE